jgi:ATPase subunit of ABC transporter with duplicated ATPase domains
LIGANGAGKSTFLRCLAQEEDMATGNVVIPKGMRVITVIAGSHTAAAPSATTTRE